ncbi:MAG: glycosyl hydrolase family 18 protein [Eubacteriales bacterium]|nr:glycosyl hydrolase family 18 protein [Eubacteriales bacterium]
MEIYVVKQGDTVDTIAQSFGVPVESVIYNNQLFSPYRLAIGQALLVPSESQPPGRSIRTGGYAYSSINEEILTQTLPWLSGLFVFSYGFTPEGYLIPPNPDDSFMIALAKDYAVKPILSLTPRDSESAFNNNLIHTVINDEAKTETLIESLTATVLQKGFQGVDLDFEYILPQDRLPYIAFVKKVRSAVNAIGYELSVALAPKTSGSQQGILYEGMDYPGLGEAADSVLLMTYEWGYTYGPPMAVAPINEVRRVVEYAVSVISPGKINLGIPNYGYDWTLPFIRGQSYATALSLEYAVQLAIDHDAVIEFDPVAMSPYFHYTAGGSEHEVWFEDVRSIQEKFDLIKEYGLRGAIYWQIMKFFRPNWILLENNFRIL